MTVPNNQASTKCQLPRSSSHSAIRYNSGEPWQIYGIAALYPFGSSISISRKKNTLAQIKTPQRNVFTKTMFALHRASHGIEDVRTSCMVKKLNKNRSATEMLPHFEFQKRIEILFEFE